MGDERVPDLITPPIEYERKETKKTAKVMPQENAVSDYKLTLANDELAKHSLDLATHFPDED